MARRMLVFAALLAIVLLSGCHKSPKALVQWRVDDPHVYALPEPPPGYQWVLLQVEVENHGYDQLPVGPEAFVLQTDLGTYDAHLFGDGLAGRLLTSVLRNRQNAKGWVAFQVPPGLTRGYLTVNQNYVGRYTARTPRVQFVQRSTGPGIAENGSYYGQISDATGRPKDVYVHGYTRKDGTYVGGHYRSRPRR